MQTTNQTPVPSPLAINHEKNGENFVFVVTPSNAPAMLAHLATLANDPASPLCWLDELAIAATIRDHFHQSHEGAVHA